MKELATPALSIVVTTHKRPSLLKRALSSILAARELDFEIVLCADEGSQETFDAASELLRERDAFIRIPTIKGPSESRNIGARLARGEWVCFLDDDDTFGESHLPRVFELIENPKPVVHYFSYLKLTESREGDAVVEQSREVVAISEEDQGTLLARNFIPINALVFPSSVLARHAFDVNLQSHEDWDFLVSLKSAGVEFVWNDGAEDAVRVHIDAGNKSRNRTAMPSLDYLSIYRKWPCEDAAIRRMRAEIMAVNGIRISEEFL